VFQKFTKEIPTFSFVIPAKAGIQAVLNLLDSGSPPAFAGVGRNDGKLLLRISEKPL